MKWLSICLVVMVVIAFIGWFVAMIGSLVLEAPWLLITLILTVAVLVVAWRAFRKFGPPTKKIIMFWLGVLLLVGSAIIWSVVILGIIYLPENIVILGKVYLPRDLDAGGLIALGAITSVFPVWIGSACLNYGLKASDSAQKRRWRLSAAGIVWLAFLILLTGLLAASYSNMGILPILGLVIFMVGLGALGLRGFSYAPSYEEPWPWDKIFRVWTYAFTPFVGAFITTNVGSFIFGSAWDSWVAVRLFFIIFGEAVTLILAHLILVRWAR